MLISLCRVTGMSYLCPSTIFPIFLVFLYRIGQSALINRQTDKRAKRYRFENHKDYDFISRNSALHALGLHCLVNTAHVTLSCHFRYKVSCHRHHINNPCTFMSTNNNSYLIQGCFMRSLSRATMYPLFYIL